MSDPVLSRPLVHIGYHKTATTWLQMQVFKPDHGYSQLAGHAEIFEHVVRPHGLAHDPATFREFIDARSAALAPGLVPVVSSETLSGNPFHGGLESELYAERLHASLPEARILISIRSQLRILPSVYMQYILRGGTLRPEAFFDGEAEPGYFGFDPMHFEYDRLLARYQALFGAENVYLLTQESLQGEAEAAMRDLAAFAGNAAYRALSPHAMAVQLSSYPETAAAGLRRINHFRRTVLNPVPVVGTGRVAQIIYRAIGKRARMSAAPARPLSDLVKARFAESFSQSNRRLADIYPRPLDLSRYF